MKAKLLFLVLVLFGFPLFTGWALYTFLAPTTFWEKLVAVIICFIAAFAQFLFTLEVYEIAMARE